MRRIYADIYHLVIIKILYLFLSQENKCLYSNFYNLLDVKISSNNQKCSNYNLTILCNGYKLDELQYKWFNIRIFYHK